MSDSNPVYEPFVVKHQTDQESKHFQFSLNFIIKILSIIFLVCLIALLCVFGLIGLIRLKQNEQHSVPIGFIYFQLPNETSPAEIWPSMIWTDVSSTYAGVFFRVNGGDAAAFGQIQDENAPRLTQVRSGNAANIKQSVSPWNIETLIPKTGWSNGVPTGSDCSCSNVDYIKFEHSSEEIRPRNMAIRVWKRTA